MTIPNQTAIEGFAGEFLHPSLDIKDDILILGFRYKTKSGEDKNLILMVRSGTISIIEDDSFVIEGKEYFLEKRGRKLIRLQERWSLGDLNQFRDDYASLKPEAVCKPKELFEELKATLKRYVELEKEIDYSLVAAWVVGTYFYPIFSAYPFLNPKAPKRSGKSQFLGLLRQLCFNAVKARPTLAALGDTVDSLRGTYLVDQGDSLLQKGYEDLLHNLADSYKKGGGKRRVMLIDKGKRDVLELETYSPKVFASIKELPEDLRDRCLIIPLLRSKHNFLDPEEDQALWPALRSKLYRFLIHHYSDIATDYFVKKITYKQKPEVVGRELELWLPFESMLCCLGAADEVPEALKRFRSQYGFAEYEPSEFESAVIQAILTRFGATIDEQLELAPREISELMSEDMFSPQTTVRQKAADVGWTIKKFNLSSEKKPRSREGVCYLFDKKKVEGIYATYFPTPPTLVASNSTNIEDLMGVSPGVGV
ncbi:MAG: hypothetical protein ABIJ81_00645 [Patescibacteria group bacterium]